MVARPGKKAELVVEKKSSKTTKSAPVNNVAPGSKDPGRTRGAARPPHRGQPIIDPNESAETFSLKDTTLPRSYITGSAAENLARASIIMDVMLDHEDHLYARMCLKLGFVPTVPPKMENAIGHSGHMSQGEISAWASSYYTSDEMKLQMAAEFNRLVKRKAANTTKIVDIIPVMENGWIKIKATDQLTEAQKAAIQEIQTTKDGVKVKLFDTTNILRLMGQTAGALIERQERSGPNGAPEVNIEIKTKDPQAAARAYQELMNQGSTKK